jgi:hypothetical protein
MKNYNGIVELTIGPLSNKSEIALVKQKACEQPQTRCAFMGSSGKTVKIWTTFTRPDNSLPKTREDAELFSPRYRLAVQMSICPKFPFDILHKEPTLELLAIILSIRTSYIVRFSPMLSPQPSSMPEENHFPCKRFRREISIDPAVRVLNRKSLPDAFERSFRKIMPIFGKRG